MTAVATVAVAAETWLPTLARHTINTPKQALLREREQHVKLSKVKSTKQVESNKNQKQTKLIAYASVHSSEFSREVLV